MDNVNPWASYFKVLLILAALICFCWIALRIFASRMGKLGRQGRAGVLEVVDTITLEPRRSVYVVRVGARYIALAISEAGIQLLLELNSEVLMPQPVKPMAKETIP